MLNTAEIRCLYIFKYFMTKYSLTAEQASGFAGSFAYNTSGTFSTVTDGMHFGIFKWSESSIKRLGYADDMDSLVWTDMHAQLDFFCEKIEAEERICILELNNITDTRSSAITVWNIEFLHSRDNFYSLMKGESDSSREMNDVIAWTNGCYSLYYQYKDSEISLSAGNTIYPVNDMVTKGDVTGTYTGNTADSGTLTNPTSIELSGIETGEPSKYDDFSNLIFYDGLTGKETKNMYS